MRAYVSTLALACPSGRRRPARRAATRPSCCSENSLPPSRPANEASASPLVGSAGSSGRAGRALEDPLVRSPHVHEQRRQPGRRARPGTAARAGACCDSPSVKTTTSRCRVEVAKKCDWRTGTSASSVVARPVVRLARRRAVDSDRCGERAREQRRVGRRHQVRQRAVGHRRDADGDVGQAAAQPQRLPLRAREPRRLARAPTARSSTATCRRRRTPPRRPARCRNVWWTTIGCAAAMPTSAGRRTSATTTGTIARRPGPATANSRRIRAVRRSVAASASERYRRGERRTARRAASGTRRRTSVAGAALR